LGFISSIYGTIIFERWNRFKETVRAIALSSLYNEGYPLKPSDLKRALEKSVDFWHIVENHQWTLRANGHYTAAYQVERLKCFSYQTASHIQEMLTQYEQNKKIDPYLGAVQSQIGRVKNKEFTQFENNLKPDIRALLIPFPHSILPKRAIAVNEDFFKDMFSPSP
jgi:hypothetical protein